ncbi:MAG TPA: efflux RND transporter periplasmic adaptor subunit [Bacteroidia bacterium]|nr:MAG: RND family efflux transporter MFP subunit [Bacteroidetes bacterium OLB10]MBV6453547.1 Macrolide export protein MacA [Bacteroidia bacterium]MBX3107046.1 efflux RND transporter periplasmic adaptor subunit [Bacteroidota bacterium]MCE7956208.1 efflux RND transporter periplasmic adaptor subunit [Bacteroidetes bacterium CHB6]OQB59886.1 MAG: Macrolide export protein MacA [Bacteroidetes bacterium ADurb.Bin141]
MKKKNNLLRNILIVAGIIIVVLVIGKKAGWFGDDSTIKVSTDKVSLQTITETVSASGKVQPEVEVKLSSDVSGEIVEMLVKEGDVVKKGQLLCKINPEIYISSFDRAVAGLNSTKAGYESSKARLDQAQSQLKKAETAYQRNKKMFEEKVISASDWEIVKSAYEVAKAEVEAAEQGVSGAQYNVKSGSASVREAKENLNKTDIFAPVDGTVSKISRKKGERVAGTSFTDGTEILRISNLQEMEVKADVGENDIIRIHLKDTALVEIDAYSPRKFKGIVTEIANTPNETVTGTDNVTNFAVKIRILRESYADLIPADNPQYSPFRPGMSATVDIQTKKAVNVIAAPIKAVTTRDTAIHRSSKQVARRHDDGTVEKLEPENTNNAPVKEVVFVNENGVAKMRVVKTGIQDVNYMEITEGLKAGDEVITDPYQAVSKKLNDGDKIKVVSRDQLFTDEKNN